MTACGGIGSELFLTMFESRDICLPGRRVVRLGDRKEKWRLVMADLPMVSGEGKESFAMSPPSIRLQGQSTCSYRIPVPEQNV